MMNSCYADPGELGKYAGAAIGERDGHAQLAQATAVPLGLLGQRRDPLGARLRGEVEAGPAIAEVGYAPERARTAGAADPNWDPPAAAHRPAIDLDRLQSLRACLLNEATSSAESARIAAT